jgi:maltose alpha-D-glucosyltransferase/alpha-amylase
MSERSAWTERIIRMRKEVPEIGWGDFKVIDNREGAVLVMRYDWRNNSVLFVHNFDDKPREVRFAARLNNESDKIAGRPARPGPQPRRR